jgi:hypothetical protein
MPLASSFLADSILLAVIFGLRPRLRERSNRASWGLAVL